MLWFTTLLLSLARIAGARYERSCVPGISSTDSMAICDMRVYGECEVDYDIDHCADIDNRCEWAPNLHELRARLEYYFIGKDAGWSYVEVLDALQAVLSSSDLIDGTCDDGDMPRLGLFDRRKHPKRDFGAWKMFAGCALDYSVDELSFNERVAYLKDLAKNSAHEIPMQSCHRLTFQLCAKGCDCTDCGQVRAADPCVPASRPQCRRCLGLGHAALFFSQVPLCRRQRTGLRLYDRRRDDPRGSTRCALHALRALNPPR